MSAATLPMGTVDPDATLVCLAQQYADLEREYLRLCDLDEQCDTLDTPPELEAAQDLVRVQRQRIRERLAATPAMGLRGLQAKAQAAIHVIGVDLDGVPFDGTHSLLLSLLRDLGAKPEGAE